MASIYLRRERGCISFKPVFRNMSETDSKNSPAIYERSYFIGNEEKIAGIASAVFFVYAGIGSPLSFTKLFSEELKTLYFNLDFLQHTSSVLTSFGVLLACSTTGALLENVLHLSPEKRHTLRLALNTVAAGIIGVLLWVVESGRFGKALGVPDIQDIAYGLAGIVMSYMLLKYVDVIWKSTRQRNDIIS